MKNTKKLLSEKEIKLIMSKYFQGKKVDDIAKEMSCSDMFVHGIIHYYIGRDTTVARRISAHNKSIVDKIKKSSNITTVNEDKYHYYECKILFGLFTLTFKPKKLK